jgi:2,4-diaminopentanoate dehydrogenase
MDPTVRERIEYACRQGGTSIHATGSSPGFITETLPLALMSIQRRLDRITIDEFADLSRRDSPGLLFDVMGFGRHKAPVTRHLADVGAENARNLIGAAGGTSSSQSILLWCRGQ